jgi:hypothetical protein
MTETLCCQPASEGAGTTAGRLVLLAVGQRLDRTRLLYEQLLGDDVTEGLCDEAYQRITVFGVMAATAIANALDARDAALAQLATLQQETPS